MEAVELLISGEWLPFLVEFTDKGYFRLAWAFDDYSRMVYNWDESDSEDQRKVAQQYELDYWQRFFRLFPELEECSFPVGIPNARLVPWRLPQYLAFYESLGRIWIMPEEYDGLPGGSDAV